MMHAGTRLISTLCVCLLSQCGLAVGAQPTGPIAQTALAGQIELVRLVDLASQRLKLNLDYDAAALKAAGVITLRLEAGLSDKELWLLTNRVLALRGFTTVRSGAGYA